MIIEQKRIRSLSVIKKVTKSNKIRVAIRNIEDRKDMLIKLGFSRDLNIGETVLPNKIGPVTRKNSEGYFIIHKDQPKEKHSRMIEWTYNQWAGKGITKEVTDSTTIEYDRYPRTFILPKAIEFTIMQKDNEKILLSPEYNIGNDEDDCIIMAINIMLEAFGKCEIVDEDINNILIPKIIKLNWRILPKGKYPWEIQSKRLKQFIKNAKGNNSKVIEKRLEKINMYNPDFIAIGTAGFSGYLIIGFQEKNIYVLESVQVNNATYILDKNWEQLSIMSKAEILKNNFHKARVIHNKNWYDEIDRILA